MKRITKIEIENFQSHKHTVIEPGRDVTVIVGHSDSGKSAFIRAIKWCLYNKAPFSPLINKDAKSASVSITFDDGTVITRYKSDKDNVYSITSNGETKTFSSVGNQPLKEVMDATGMHEVDMFNRQISLNIVEQFDNLFFISENASDRGTLVSQMAQTEVCDNAIALCSTEINAVKRLVTSLSKTLKEAKAKLADFSHVEDLGKDIEALSQLKDSADNVVNTMQRMKDCVGGSKLAYEKLSAIRIPNIPDGDMESVSEKIATVEATSQLTSKLQNYIDSAQRIVPVILKHRNTAFAISAEDFESVEQLLRICTSNIEKSSALKAKTDRIKADIKTLASNEFSSRDTKIIEDIKELEEKLKNAADSRQTLSDILLKIKSSESQAVTYQGLIGKRLEAENDAKNKYAQMLKSSELCPVCGSPMSEEHIHDAMSIIEN